jgi:hypothetical protein
MILGVPFIVLPILNYADGLNILLKSEQKL